MASTQSTPPPPADDPGYLRFKGDALSLEIGLSLFALLSVVLRFIARSKTKASYGLDDAFIILSLIAFFGVTGSNIWCKSS